MKPMVESVPRPFVKQVMKNHDRTQDMLSESSERAGRECYLSQETCKRARDTLNTWKDAMERF